MKGIYILLIKIKKNLKIKIGSLGVIEFNKGCYAYVGSSQNNLIKRVHRHYSNNKKIHWHIDYLLNNDKAVIKSVYCKELSKEWECRIAKELSDKGEIVQGFGSSDCKCSSHLIKIGM